MVPTLREAQTIDGCETWVRVDEPEKIFGYDYALSPRRAPRRAVPQMRVRERGHQDRDLAGRG